MASTLLDIKILFTNYLDLTSVNNIYYSGNFMWLAIVDVH